MVLDRLDNRFYYYRLHPFFGKAFAFLEKKGMISLAEGRYAIDSDRIFALVSFVSAKGKKETRLEFHRKYIDIQVVLRGYDIIGYKPKDECSLIGCRYNSKKDTGFFRDKPDSWFYLRPKNFVIFFPEDVHAPLAGPGTVKKVVIKVATGF